MPMMLKPQELQEKALSFLAKERLMVLGTSLHDKVWSATVHFVETSEFEMIFFSNPSARHCQNILKNPHVSAVVTNEKTATSIQFAGTCRIADGIEWDKYFEIYSQKVKNAAQRVDQVIYVIKPDEVWMIDEKLTGGRSRTQIL
ncbi:MAG: pyridoxamine 5'-phosphate oxidase family protein [Candidatus Levybacteria bacterium]|nr:pyridoxamine 5'-phosphate oxidase family protein [Candidatus Levybacteria bacterium]